MLVKITAINQSKSLIVAVAQQEIDGFIAESWFWIRATEAKLSKLKVGDEIEVPEKALNEIG